jgi:hypothetical protein
MVVTRTARTPRMALRLLVAAILVAATTIPAEAARPEMKPLKPHFSNAVAFDRSAPLRKLAARTDTTVNASPRGLADRSLVSTRDTGFSGDGAVQTDVPTADIPAPIANFEGLRNTDNPFRQDGTQILVNPPDSVGDVGPSHYVEMVNLSFAVYSKTGTRLLGPTPLGALWQGFEIPDCTDLSGDPIVLYDQFVDRWILTQFTTRGLADPTLPFYNCVAVSASGDPTGAYYRYAFITQEDPDGGFFFPDYPKYGVWTNAYVMTTRDFGSVDGYGISVYALEKSKMVNGEPDARFVQFFLDAEDPAVDLATIGDGLLPADIDGKQKPMSDAAIPIVGTQDDEWPYGATFDALNIWDLRVKWRSTPIASLELNTQLPVEEFDSVYPCVGPLGSRDCLPQPGITDPAQYLDILSYRQRPTWRLAYRNFKSHESLVTNQSVEAAPAQAGVRWYEIRRDPAGEYSVYQQGTYAPDDGIHRWMGSVAQDKKGNIAAGYSVVNATNVYPGIRYTGRLAGDPLGEMTLGEGVIKNGSGSQTNVNSRWGDYTSLNIDPVDDCTFWYVNEYYETTVPPPDRLWQTRIASFKLPGC